MKIKNIIVVLCSVIMCGVVFNAFPQSKLGWEVHEGWKSKPVNLTKGAVLVPIKGHMKIVLSVATNGAYRVKSETRIFYVGPVDGEFVLETEVGRFHKEIGRSRIK